MTTVEYVKGAERMITAARLARGGIYVRFADDRSGIVPFSELDLPEEAVGVQIPQPHLVEIRLTDGTVEELPWDFARHFADPGYREWSLEAAERGRAELGARVRELRTRRGVTQQQIADRADVTRVSVARIEAGRQLPRYETLVSLAGALGVSVGALFDGEGEEEAP